MVKHSKRIAIVGGGPSGLFVFKRFVETGRIDFQIDIFEAKGSLGAGMPYSDDGANNEHVTNVSGNEIPDFVISLSEWIKSLSAEELAIYHMDANMFTDYKVLPRLLFGEYLRVQFEELAKEAELLGMATCFFLNRPIIDVVDPTDGSIRVIAMDGEVMKYDYVIICTGHNWPAKNEGAVPGYFDSPYPPAKLAGRYNHPVAIRGASLTAIDAIRTLARQQGHFLEERPHRLTYLRKEDVGDFKIVMHSRHGILPCIRFHLDDSHLSKKGLLSEQDLVRHREENDGFISLDFLFDHDFKESFREKDPAFYAAIQEKKMEEFVQDMMALRESIDPFLFFKGEYAEAERSIRRKQSVYWKEMLAVLSFAMNYPAKYLSAEDYLRLQEILMPLISIVIAFVPQRSCEELIALHDAGLISLVDVGSDSHIETHAGGGITYHYKNDIGDDQSKRYATFVDCIGQPHLSLDMFPFRSLVKDGTVSQALLRFRSGSEAEKSLREGNKDLEQMPDETYYLKVPGLTITDSFQTVDTQGVHNKHLYLMAVPYLGGFNPDYSGLDFCERASAIVVDSICGDVDKAKVGFGSL